MLWAKGQRWKEDEALQELGRHHRGLFLTTPDSDVFILAAARAGIVSIHWPKKEARPTEPTLGHCSSGPLLCPRHSCPCAGTPASCVSEPLLSKPPPTALLSVPPSLELCRPGVPLNILGVGPNCSHSCPQTMPRWPVRTRHRQKPKSGSANFCRWNQSPSKTKEGKCGTRSEWFRADRQR